MLDRKLGRGYKLRKRFIPKRNINLLEFTATALSGLCIRDVPSVRPHQAVIVEKYKDIK